MRLFIRAVVFSVFIFQNSSAQVSYLNAVNTHSTDAFSMVISPDNLFAYVVARDEVHIYQRNPANGQLSFLDSLSQMSDGTQFYDISVLNLSADAKYLYVEGSFNSFVFSRDSLSGLLTPFQTLTEYFFPLYYPTTNNNILTTRDGKFVYITGRKNLFIYERDSTSGMLNLVDTLKDLNDIPSLSFEVSMEWSPDEKMVFITGGNSISVYNRDVMTGLLTFRSNISGTNYVNQGLGTVLESKMSADGKFLYAASLSQGSGALVVLSVDTAADTLSVIQTFSNNIRPHYLSITPDDRVICISSGSPNYNDGSMIFLERDSVTGRVSPLSTFFDDLKFGQKKYVDIKNRYLYDCPVFTDSIYIYRFSLFMRPEINLCAGDSITLQAWGNYQSYLWSTGSTQSTINVTAGGYYSLSATDGEGYTFTDSVLVTIRPLPSVSLGDDVTLYVGEEGYLFAGYNFSHYQWSVLSDTSMYLYVSNDSVLFGTQMITLTVTDEYGCMNTDSINITFSPNPAPVHSETLSDIFIYPNPFSSKTILQSDLPFVDAELTIYNCLGVAVKTMQNISGPTAMILCLDLAYGLYVLRVKDADRTFTTRLIMMGH